METSLKWASGLSQPGLSFFHSLDWTPTCENMVLLVAVDMGLQASSGCRGVVDAAVGTGKQAAPRDGIDTFTPKCIEGLADMLAPYGLRIGGRTRG